MYESFGFRTAGVRRRYYHDNNEDALIMWRTQGVARQASRPAARDRDVVRRHLRRRRHAGRRDPQQR